jgi:hypothetical protein
MRTYDFALGYYTRRLKRPDFGSTLQYRCCRSGATCIKKPNHAVTESTWWPSDFLMINFDYCATRLIDAQDDRAGKCLFESTSLVHRDSDRKSELIA